MNDLIPVVNYNPGVMSFITFSDDHATKLDKYVLNKRGKNVKHNYKGNTTKANKEIMMFIRTIDRDRKRNKYFEALDLFINVLNYDPNIAKFIKVYKLKVECKQLSKTIKAPDGTGRLVTVEDNNAMWRFGKSCEEFMQSQIVYIIELREEIVSYLSQQYITYFKFSDKYVLDSQIVTLMEYLEGLFTQTEENKRLASQEIDDLVKVCRDTYNDRKI